MFINRITDPRQLTRACKQKSWVVNYMQTSGKAGGSIRGRALASIHEALDFFFSVLPVRERSSWIIGHIIRLKKKVCVYLKSKCSWPDFRCHPPPSLKACGAVLSTTYVVKGKAEWPTFPVDRGWRHRADDVSLCFAFKFCCLTLLLSMVCLWRHWLLWAIFPQQWEAWLRAKPEASKVVKKLNETSSWPIWCLVCIRLELSAAQQCPTWLLAWK